MSIQIENTQNKGHLIVYASYYVQGEKWSSVAGVSASHTPSSIQIPTHATTRVFFQEIDVYAFFLIYPIRQNHAGSDIRKMMPDPVYRIAIPMWNHIELSS